VVVGHLPGQHLIVHELPQSFRLRYGLIPESIFVRECYSRLYEIVSGRMLDPSMNFGATLFTGVPGIGKSLFLVYFIHRFLIDANFEDKSFAVEFAKGTYVCFKPTADATKFQSTPQNGSYMQSKDFLLLCDIADAVEPVSRAKWTFLFSSPAPLRYKEILKNAPCFRYTMPTWSEQELMFVGDIPLWHENFVLVGGVPRLVFSSDSPTLLEETLEKKGGAIADAFFTFSFGTVDLLQNYMLVHINPPMSSDGDYEYDGKTVYSFASDYVFKQLMEKHNGQMLARAIGLFNSGAASETIGAASAGNLFEKVCLWLKPLDGKCITADSLEGGDNVQFDVPAGRHMLSHDWKETGQLPVNALILPRISNLESGDAFCVTQCGSNSFRLVVFQITVGVSHPVKVNGLLKIVQAFPEGVRNNITDKWLFFVIPKHCALNKMQRLVTQKGTQFAHLVSDFKQFVYRHDI
jgi:hypothetical protein